MIPASFYQSLYFIIVCILTFLILPTYSGLRGSAMRQRSESELAGLFLLVLFLTFFIGLRPVSGRYFCDMSNYAAHYEILEGNQFFFDPQAENFIFDNLFSWWISNSLGFSSFCLLIAAIYFITAYLGLKRLFPQNELAAYLVFLAGFCTFSMGTNGIKAGAAASIFILAMSYRHNLKICIPLVLISLGFHHSMQMPIGALLITQIFKKSKWYFYGWFFCLLMALGHVSFFANLFASVTDETGADYLMGASNGADGTQGGFRLDFILYSSAPIAIGYYYIMKKKMQVSEMYRDLLHYYLCTNGIWMLCMYANFTNRIAYLSWFMYPIVLIFPFLNENFSEYKYCNFVKTMKYHLYFTLFMDVVYYGLIR